MRIHLAEARQLVNLNKSDDEMLVVGSEAEAFELSLPFLPLDPAASFNELVEEMPPLKHDIFFV
ncbi:hypothetical protein D3C73_1577330 [compost metagenome]